MIFENDIHMIPLYGVFFAFLILLLFLCISLHEMGHALWFDIVKKKKIKLFFVYNGIMKMKFKAGEQKDYDDLTDKEYVAVNVWGIVFGLIPILLVGLLYFPAFLMAIPYLIGCIPDIKEIISNLNTNED